MNKTVTFELTDEVFLRCLRHNLGFRNVLKLIIAYGVVGGIAIIACFAIGGDAGRTAIFIVCVVGLLAALYYWYGFARSRKSALSAIAKLPHRIQKYTFTDESVVVQHPIGQSELTWDMLEDIECFSDLWQLRFLNSTYLLPSELVDQELGLFIECKARERGISVFRERFLLARETAAGCRQNNGRGSMLLLWSGVLVVFSAMIFVWYTTPAGTASRSLEEQFIVKSDAPKLLPVKIQNGEHFDLSVTVISGSPVGIRIGKEAVLDDNKLEIKSAGLFEVEQVRSFQRKDKWTHSSPAIIVVTSTDQSEVSLKVVISRAK